MARVPSPAAARVPTPRRRAPSPSGGALPTWLHGLTVWLAYVGGARATPGASAPDTHAGAVDAYAGATARAPGPAAALPQPARAPLAALGSPAPGPAESPLAGPVSAADVARLAQRWDPASDPDAASFFAGAPPPADVTWGSHGVLLWGADDEVLRGNAQIVAPEARALAHDDGARAAALGSILGQAPARLRAFLAPNGSDIAIDLRVAVGDGRAEPLRLPLAMADTLPVYPNGTRAAYADRRGSWSALLRKFSLKLAECRTRIRFDGPEDVLTGVLGVARPATIALNDMPDDAVAAPRALGQLLLAAGAPATPVMGTFSPVLGVGVGSGGITVGSDRDTVTVGLTSANAPDAEVRVWLGSSYGLLGLHNDAAPPVVELFDPYGAGLAPQRATDRNAPAARPLLLRVPLNLANLLAGAAVIA